MEGSTKEITTNYIKQGLKFKKAGKLKEAIECYDEAIKIDPENNSAWSNKARALDELNMMTEAMKCYKISLELNPNNASVWNNKGYAFRKQFKYKSAIECYDNALKIRPNYAKAWYNKGYSLEKQGKYDESIQCFNKAIEFNPQNEKYITSKNNVYEKLKEIQMAFDNDSSKDHPEKAEESDQSLVNVRSSDILDQINSFGTDDLNETGDLKNESELSNIFVIMEKLQNAINTAKSLETLTVFESQLEEILVSIKEKKNSLSKKSEEKKCVICLDQPASMICIPCGHICVCESCKAQMTKKKCPVCNQHVKNIYKVYIT